MRLREQITYPADVDTVFAMLCDPAYRRRVCDATYALDHRVSVQPRDDIVMITVVRVMPADVPPIIRRVVGDRIEVEQVERWSTADPAGRRDAELSVRIVGQPARMSGTITLRGSGRVTIGTVEGEMHVNIPVFGGRLAAQMAQGFRFALAVEADIARDHLTR
jgi:Protein of unknown function (DUF2505)